jgi:hypothetical protein
MFDRLQNYEGQYHLVSFYPGTPYSSCIFYQANQSENRARLSFYPQIFGTPTVIINGEEARGSAGLSNTLLDDITGNETWLQVKVEESDGVTRDVTITLENFGGSSVGAGKLYAIVVEKEIMYFAPNGENVHHNVFRRFLSSTNGDQVDLSSDIAVKNYQYQLDAEWQADETYVIAWMTGSLSKEIINSGTKFDDLILSSEHPVEKSLQISVYPNPAKSFVNVTIPEGLKSGQLKIMDLTGRTMFENVLTQGQENVSVEIISWQAGMYLVELTKDNRSITQFMHVVR